MHDTPPSRGCGCRVLALGQPIATVVSAGTKSSGGGIYLPESGRTQAFITDA